MNTRSQIFNSLMLSSSKRPSQSLEGGRKIDIGNSSILKMSQRMKIKEKMATMTTK